MLIISHCSEKTPERNKLKGKRYILAHGFKGFTSLSLGSIAFRTVVKQNVMEIGT
jgi:hypothetical protein